MKAIRNGIVFAFVLSAVIFNGNLVFANELDILTNEANISISEEYTVDFDNIQYEDTLSFSEMLEYYQENDIQQDIINQFIFDHFSVKSNNNNRNGVQYSSPKSEVRYTTTNLRIDNPAPGYKTQARFTLALKYNADSSGRYSNPSSIVSLSNPHVYTGYGNKSAFNGSLRYKVVNFNTFYYTYYGELYKKGTVRWSVGGTIGIGKTGSVEATISNGDGFIKNISYNETVKMSGIQ